ncbi:hypothetical protein HMPREF9554_01482 [Treponema phagedenis F0421]|nr:hypothetical protein HMPREF9554_01482 [Treponema phagedenis F0421]
MDGRNNMKITRIFILIVGLVLAGVLFMNYGQTVPIDCVGAAIILAGGAFGVYDCVKRNKKRALIPLGISLLILIITGFVRFKGLIVLAAVGLAAFVVYAYLSFYEKKK